VFDDGFWDLWIQHSFNAAFTRLCSIGRDFSIRWQHLEFGWDFAASTFDSRRITHMLPKNTHVFLYGKGFVAMQERRDLDYDLITFSSHDKTFTTEPGLYADMVFDRDVFLKSVEKNFIVFSRSRVGKLRI
jgi:hypothetical protein